MSIKLNTESEIVQFLSQFFDTKKIKESTDPYVEEYQVKYENDKDEYNLKNTATEAERSDEAEEIEAAVEIDAEQKNASHDVHASLDGLIRAVNVLRSGESLKRSAIRDEVGDYYDRLDDAERDLLVLFMRELGDILTGEHSGIEAQNPDDEPTNITVSRIEKETEETEERPVKKKKIIKKSKKEIEDTTPPIKVNAPQDLAEVTRKFKSLAERK